MKIFVNFTATNGDFTLDIDTIISAGTVTAVLGPNGSGKSTFLRVLAGLHGIDSGEIILDDRVVNAAPSLHVPPQDRGVGVVFQDYALFPHLTVLENVAFGPRSLGASKKAARAKAQEQLNSLGITELADRKPHQISGGQAQRVALARALATQPRVLLLDEPLAALDAQTRESVRTELEKQIKAFDGCVVFVTHDPLDAMLLADRVIVLENGVIAQEGTPGELSARPSTDYVAALMGVNLMRGTALDGVLHVEGGGFLYIPQRELNGEVLAVLRPEAITLHQNEPEGSARNVWQGTIRGLTPMHDRIRVSIDASPPVVATVTHSSVAELKLSAGTPIWVSAKTLTIEAFSK
jgi:molybdate transport system ATP-binding protein